MGETLDIVKELENIFSDRYIKKDKIRRLVRNIEYVKRLFTKLSNVIIKYENIDGHKHFLNQLIAFKTLIEEHVEKATQHHSIILIIDDYVSAVREDYKIIRNCAQTLEDINAKIKKKISKKMDKDKIGQLIIRAVEEKIPNLICSNQNQSANNNKKFDVVKEFYDYFIKYISYVRESLGNKFDDNKYRYKLESLQSKLLSIEPVNMDDYFSKILSKIINDRGYSTEILLKNLAENPMVHISVSNKSSTYCDMFIKIFQKLKHPGVKSSDKKCIEPLSTLIFQFDEDTYKKLHMRIFQDSALIDLVWKSIYDKGIHLYLNGPTIATTINKIDNFRPRSMKHMDMLKGKFSRLFSLILSNYPNLLSILQQSIIDEKNALGTYQLLTDIYGQRVKNLDFSNEMIDVRYCFNYYYFKSLIYEDLEDVSGLPIFCRLLFYIHISNDDIGATQTLEDIKAKEDQYQNQIMSLKKYFLRVYNEDNHKHLKDLVEILKIMISIQNFDFRYKCTKSILSCLDSDKNSERKLDVKVKTLKMFFDECIQEEEMCLRLAQSFNIHLLKDVIKNDEDVLKKLCDFNYYFKLFNKKLNDLKHKFVVNTDLTPGVSIPYYLSTKLLLGDEDEVENDDEETKEEKEDKEEMKEDKEETKVVEEFLKTVISILFKVFTCSSDTDKHEFLKNQNYIRKEFQNLSSSIAQLIEFYDDNNLNTIYEELQEKSISYILDGFSQTNGETLKEREQNARLIIDNFINYRLEHIQKIVESSSKEEIFHTFDTVLKRRDTNLQEWVEQTSKLGDKIYFLYCYHKYSENEFDEWFRELNPYVTNICYNKVKTKRISVKEEFETNMKAFEVINIKYLQHNQVGALSLIYDYLDDSERNKDNLFIKIGTGQGKSLTIAESARKIIELNRINNRAKQQIFIVTCYDHLAKRDYENYLNYYKYFNITSMHCSNTSSTKDFDSKDIIYLDLETYFHMIRREGYKALTESTSIHLPNFTNAVLIMDEFDSLILDSDEILQTTYEFVLKFRTNVENIKSKKDIKQLFDEKFINEFEKKFPKVFERWCDVILNDKRNEDTNSTAKTFQDGLGKELTLADSFLCALAKSSKASFVHFFLDPRTFYSKFKQVIGFSGSITESDMNKFKTLFHKKKSIYYEIPPFFGLFNLKNNRTFTNQPGKIVENRYDFLKVLRDDIRKRHSEQPILIFADSVKKNNEDQSDYHYIYDMLIEAKNSFLRDSTILSINSEDQINENIHKIGKLGTITLATRILGRGADIKVDRSIEKGLHLILTYYPKRENIYVQMLGRTARQDEKGSYSVIARFEKKFVEVTEVTIDPRIQKLHDTTEYFYKHINESKRKMGLTWPLFSCLLEYMDTDDLLESNLNSFIKENIL